MYVQMNLKFRKLNCFKKRGYLKKTKIKLTLLLNRWESKQSFCIFFKNASYLELNFLRFIFFKFRRCFMRKKYYLTLNIVPNFMFSKKSKNARMGKGIGSFKRPVRLIKMYKPFIYSTCFSKKRFCILKNILLKKSPNTFF